MGDDVSRNSYVKIIQSFEVRAHSEELAELPPSPHYQKPSISRLTFLASDFKSRLFGRVSAGRLAVGRGAEDGRDETAMDPLHNISRLPGWDGHVLALNCTCKGASLTANC